MKIDAQFWKLSHLDNDDLESGLESLIKSEREATARVVAHLAEVLERRLHLRQAYSSMTAYCRAKLGLREDDAGRRIVAARLARRFPQIFPLLDRGELSLSVICKLRHYLTEANHEQLIQGVRGMSYRQAEAWLAGHFPRADVRSSVRKLPAARAHAGASELNCPPTPAVAPAPANDASANPPLRSSARNDAPAFPAVEALPIEAPPVEAPPAEARPVDGPQPALSPPPRRPDSGLVEPLSAARYRVQFSAGAELKDKLELARDLMSHANPSGDFAPIVERALDLLIADLKKKRFGLTDKPKPARTGNAKPERISNQTRREVAERDNMRCAYVDKSGRRCNARAFIQHDHRDARGRGGGSGSDNVRHLCAAHNRLEAERVYGRAYVERAIAKRRNGTRENPE